MTNGLYAGASVTQPKQTFAVGRETVAGGPTPVKNWGELLSQFGTQPDLTLGMMVGNMGETPTPASPPPSVFNPDTYADGLYLHLLGRGAKPGESKGWADRIRNGEPRARIIMDMMQTPEFREACAKPMDHQTFVRAAYQGVMGRGVDPKGLEGWTKRLEAGATREEVILGLLDSDEFREKFGEKMLPVKGINQGLENACGTACLAMGLNTLAAQRNDKSRPPFTFQELDKDTRFQTHGVTPGPLILAAKRQGVNAKMYNQCDFNEIKGHLDQRHVLLLAIDADRNVNANHWVVVHGYTDNPDPKKRTITITDPMDGTTRTENYEEFCRKNWNKIKQNGLDLGIDRFMIVLSNKDDLPPERLKASHPGVGPFWSENLLEIGFEAFTLVNDAACQYQQSGSFIPMRYMQDKYNTIKKGVTPVYEKAENKVTETGREIKGFLDTGERKVTDFLVSIIP